MKRILLLIFFLFVFIGSIYLLVTESSLLTISLIKGSSFPFGTFSTWMGLIAFPLILKYGIKPLYIPISNYHKSYNVILQMIVFFNLLWGGISYGLAGNWSFSFGQSEGFRGSAEAFRYFETISFIALILPVFFVIIYGIHTYYIKEINQKGKRGFLF